ncbi:hypothetical protein Vadar_012601 [Vaccinium darrowii]|uniref:Uncharacterized protein n=1 Tax=Vaccinium darrowii TaxID=229202 RepID=A0ACB7XYL0_9ERIC|nr:hypothetical protein Vadar_012601 [Vaccinium darrowii]
MPVDGNKSPFSLLYTKSRRIKPCLRQFNKEFYSDLQNKVVVAREELSDIQKLCAHTTSDPILIGYEKLCLVKYNELRLAEEALYKQKSRINWLNLGDNNTIFFHKKVATHRMMNKILTICDGSDTRLEDPQAVKGEILRFYKKILGSKFELKRRQSIGSISEVISFLGDSDGGLCKGT